MAPDNGHHRAATETPSVYRWHQSGTSAACLAAHEAPALQADFAPRHYRFPGRLERVAATLLAVQPRPARSDGAIYGFSTTSSRVTR